METCKVLVIYGTRPEYIKLTPIIHELKKDDRFIVRVVSTGQHDDLLESVSVNFGEPPDIDYAIMHNAHSIVDVFIEVMHNIKRELFTFLPDYVVVQGDTATTVAAATTSYLSGFTVAHVEAGLRTFDINSPFPEEGNRRMISGVSSLHFCPTYNAKLNLDAEKIYGEKHVVGNTEIDAAFYALDRCDPIFKYAHDNYIVATIHRRENFKNIDGICAAIKRASKEIRVIIPVHPNPKARDGIWVALGKESNVDLIDPLDQVSFIHLIAKSRFIVTDSGGVQESASALGVPVIVARDKTDRPEAIDSGNAILGGIEEDSLYEAIQLVLKNESIYSKMAKAVCPYGDGNAAQRIVDILWRNHARNR